MDPKLSPVEDTCASPFWLRCTDCSGALASAQVPEIPDAITMLARPFLKMLALKLELPTETRAMIAGPNPFSMLGDEKLLGALLTLRCADCTVKANGETAAA